MPAHPDVRTTGPQSAASDAWWVPYLCVVLYPVQFERDPCAGVDRVVRMILKQQPLDASPWRYLSALDEALQSTVDVAKLLPQPHADATLRRYLATLRERLHHAAEATR